MRMACCAFSKPVSLGGGRSTRPGSRDRARPAPGTRTAPPRTHRRPTASGAGQHRGRRRDAQPGPRADAAAVPGQHVLVPARRRLRDRLRPAVPGRHARDHHRYRRRQRMPLPPRLPRIGQETPPATPAGTPGPVPVPAGRWRRMQPASHDEDTGVVLSVLVCQGWYPNHHHGPAPSRQAHPHHRTLCHALPRQPSNFTAK